MPYGLSPSDLARKPRKRHLALVCTGNAVFTGRGQGGTGDHDICVCNKNWTESLQHLPKRLLCWLESKNQSGPGFPLG